jgi:DNA adenine methylase
MNSKNQIEKKIDDNVDKILMNVLEGDSKTNKIKHLKPLIKWSGGKSDEIKMFEKYFPKYYTIYIEPFVGGGSVYFYLNPINAVISDIHTELVDLYKNIGNGKSQKIFEFMEKNPNDENTYYKVRDEMIINDTLDSAKRFYYQRKTCFRGMSRYNKNGKLTIPIISKFAVIWRV